MNHLISTSLLIHVYNSFILAPTFKSVFAADATVEQRSKIQTSICTFPFVLLDGVCQCPRYLKFLFGKCVGATPDDYNNQPPTPTDPNTDPNTNPYPPNPNPDPNPNPNPNPDPTPGQ